MKDIKKSQQVQNKREKEKQIVDLMIHLYCRKKHKTVEKHHGLCEECEKLRNYAAMRVDKCPFMETKTFCSNCRVHCYKPQMREEIRNELRSYFPKFVISFLDTLVFVCFQQTLMLLHCFTLPRQLVYFLNI